MHAALISGFLVLAQTSAPAAPAPVVLACKLPVADADGILAVPAERTFRIGQGSFQEWDPTRRRFGDDLCKAFSCQKTADRLEGTIGSASVIYTVGVESATGQGYWSVVGASGLAAKKGACTVVPAPAP